MTANVPTTRTEALRRARRVAVRELAQRSHPDIGGDPATFTAELDRIEYRFRTDLAPTLGTPIIAIRTRPIRSRLRRVLRTLRSALSRTRYVDLPAPGAGRTTAAPDGARRTSGESQ